MAKRINVNIEWESGITMTEFKSIQIEQDLFNHHTFEIIVPFAQLESADQRFFNKSHTEVVGKRVTFTFKSLEREGSRVLSGKKDEFVFKGIVTSLSLMNTSDLSNVFVIKGHGNTILLDDGVHNRWILDTDLKGTVEKILQDYPGNLLKRKISTNEAFFLATPQYQESNFQYLNRLAFLNFQWCYYNGTELVFGQDEGKEAEFLVDGVQTFEMSLNLTPTSFGMQFYDAMNDESYNASSKDVKVSAGGPLGKFVTDESEKLFNQPGNIPTVLPLRDASMIDLLVSKSKKAKVGDQIKFKGKGEHPNVNVGSIVAVKAAIIREKGKSAEDFGKFRVTRVTHYVSQSSNYSNEFEAVPDQQDTALENPFYATLTNFPVCNSDRAVVVDNNDPDVEGRVKVKFINWMEPEEFTTSPWIQVSTPYAGNSKGFLFLPEIDEHVLVGYERGACSFPYVMGSLYRQVDKIDYTADPKNNFKVIATRGGNRLYFSDEEGEQMIVMTNMVGHAEKTLISLFFKDGGNKISIKTGDSNGEILIESANKVTVKTKTLDIEATGDINISSDANINIKAKQGLNLQAGGALEAKGATATVEGKSSLDLKSTGKAKMDAALAEVSSSGMTTIKGTMVMIN